MKTHYLDNAATTEPSQIAKEAFCGAAEVYGNPSSVHFMGAKASRLLSKSREQISASLGVGRTSNDKVVFTSSGTEANCTALIGCFEAKRKNFAVNKTPCTVIISDGEHPSVENAALSLESKGCNIIRIPTSGGRLDLDYLQKSLNRIEGNLLCAAFMLVNNETGALYDVKSASDLVKSKFPDTLVHCDAVQGFMKVKFTPYSLGADTLSASAHKIHGFRGAGFLYISEETMKRKKITSILPGGGQEYNLRSGTENLCAIAAFAATAADMKKNFDSCRMKIQNLRLCFENKIKSLEEKGLILKRPESSIPDIINITLPGIKSETMLNYLSGRGICVSAGSACSAHSKKASRALTAFGAGMDDIDSSLRISMSYINTSEDIEALCGALEEGMASLIRFK